MCARGPTAALSCYRSSVIGRFWTPMAESSGTLPPGLAGVRSVLSSNFFLASLSPADAASIRPYLRPVELEHKKILFEAGDRIGHLYFPTGVVISLVIGLSTGEMVEAAMVGKDGVIGAASALDGRISLSRAIVQLAGPALVCDILELK